MDNRFNTDIPRTISEDNFIYDLFLHTFESAYYVGLTDNTFIVYRRTEDLISKYSNINNYLDSIDKYITEDVHPEDAEEMTKITRPEYIRERLQRENSYTFVFRDISTKSEVYFRMQFIRGNDDNHAALCFTNVNDEVLMKRQYDAVVDSLAETYILVFTVNVLSEKIQIVKASPEFEDIVNFVYAGAKSRHLDDLVHVISRTFLFPEDRERFVHEMLFDGLIERLTREKVAVYTYRFVLGGNVHFYRATIVLSEKESNQITVGLKNIDAEVLRLSEEEHEKSKIASMLDGLSREYHSLWFVEGKSGYVEPIRCRFAERVPEDIIYSQKPIRLDDFLRRYIDENVLESDRPMLREALTYDSLKRSIPDDDVYQLTHRAINPENKSEYVYHQIAFAKAVDDDGRINFVVAFRLANNEMKEQIRKQNALEDALRRLEAANKAKSAFLFNMSHDIRTPMNAIKGFTELAYKHSDDKELVHNYLGKAMVSSDHLQELIDDILDLAGLESGKAELSLEPIEVNTAYRMVNDIVGNMMETKGVEYIYDNRLDGDIWIMADKLRVRQIVLNVLNNALKFTPPGGRITHSIENVNDYKTGKVTLKVEISDTGIGMSEDFLNHVFEEFSRERTSTESGVKGSGLGMAIVKNLVNMMSGSIYISSKVNEGTCVNISIPFDVYDGAAVDNHVEKINYDFAGKRVLVAEDNDINREIITAILKEQNIEVVEAKDGEAAYNAFEAADEGYFDIILMDIQMPVMDGYEATIKIRKNPKGKKLPIIALSANAFETDVKKSVVSGMNDHVAKPIDVKRLYATMAKYIL